MQILNKSNSFKENILLTQEASIMVENLNKLMGLAIDKMAKKELKHIEVKSIHFTISSLTSFLIEIN